MEEIVPEMLNSKDVTLAGAHDLAEKWVADPGCEKAFDALRESIYEELWK